MKQFNNETIDFVHFESLYPPNTRFNEIKQLVEFIKAGNSCQIVGLPGVGRSNLLRLLSYNRNIRLKHLGENQKWFHFATTDFSEIRRRSFFDATKFLFLSLVDSLRDRRMMKEYEKVNQIFKESLLYSPRHSRGSGNLESLDPRFHGDDKIGGGNDMTQPLNDELVLFQGLKKAVDFLAIEKELTIVFLFDRFEEYVPMLTPEFFSNLRVLRNRAKYRFSVVFSLSRPLEDLLESSLFADFYEFLTGHAIYLSLYDKAGADFRISYLEKITGKKIKKKVLDEILNLTAGHGKLTRLALEAILASSKSEARNPKHETNSNNQNVNDRNVLNLENSDFDIVSGFDIRISDLSGFLLEQKTILGALSEIWQGLTPSEQKFINNVITRNPNSSLRSGEAGEAISRDRHAKLSLARDDDSSYLVNTGLIKNDRITIPLFETFATLLRQSSGEARETIILDPINQIKKGDIVLSDQLTSSEFKLLKFLIQNPDRIIEREEIIGAVWKESQSTAGVTEQALDQLIFRLRKKIESDPNNPQHIQTVKGRGIKFSR